MQAYHTSLRVLTTLALVLLLLAGQVLVPASPSHAKGNATSVSPPKDEVVTITVNIDAPGLSEEEAKKWKSDAEKAWNAGFDRSPVVCFKLQLVVNITPQPALRLEDIKKARPRPDHHMIYRASFRKPSGDIVSGVRGGPSGDTTYPLQNDIWGAWGDDVDAFGPGGYAHEVGHLMGLGDDYHVVSQNPRRAEPNPGRKNTLMADGGPVDKQLVDRLAEQLRRAKKLPSCWKGNMHSESTWSGTGCTEVWNTNVRFIVAPDGTLAGSGTADHVGVRGCQRIFTTQATHRVFDVMGRLVAGRFELQLNETPKDMVGGAFTGLLNYTLFLPGGLSRVGDKIVFGPTQPTLLAPLVAPGRAEGTTTIEYRNSYGKATGVHLLRLRCEGCEGEPVG